MEVLRGVYLVQDLGPLYALPDKEKVVASREDVHIAKDFDLYNAMYDYSSDEEEAALVS